MTNSKVKFCAQCKGCNECKACDKTFDRRSKFESTSFFQFEKDITSFLTENVAQMILVDISCPNSVISVHDFPNLKKNLSRFQRENLKMRDVEEKFKF